MIDLLEIVIGFAVILAVGAWVDERFLTPRHRRSDEQPYRSEAGIW